MGFYSLFDYIVGDEAYRIYIFKGGPGNGKSTLMARIAAEAADLGYDVEEFHCSSDIDSLDAVAIPALRAAVLDGTAPHVIDPQYPGCVERIINLGQFWDHQLIAARREAIVELTDQNKACYPRVYHYLKAAAELHEDMYDINSSCTDFDRVNRIADDLIDTIFAEQTRPRRRGKVRRLFASAYTPQGQVNELHNIMEDFPHQYIIKGEPGTGRDLILERIASHAAASGYDVEAYPCPIVPKRLDHVALPQLGTAVISCHAPHIYERNGADVINLNDCLDQAKRSAYQYTLHKDFVLFDELINLALKQLRRAKAIHDELEQQYIPHMDFSRLEQVKEEILSDILR